MGSPDRDLQHGAFAVLVAVATAGGLVAIALRKFADMIIHRHAEYR